MRSIGPEMLTAATTPVARPQARTLATPASCSATLCAQILQAHPGQGLLVES